MAGPMSESKMLIGVATCRTCRREIGRTFPVPEQETVGTSMVAPFNLRTDCGHSTFSDLNWHYELAWYEQGQEPVEDRWWEVKP